MSVSAFDLRRVVRTDRAEAQMPRRQTSLDCDIEAVAGHRTGPALGKDFHSDSHGHSRGKDYQKYGHYLHRFQNTGFYRGPGVAILVSRLSFFVLDGS